VILSGISGGIGIDSSQDGNVDVIDERGFVDGVKVARKCSKANVLGKAVEYIRVLKKREARLKAEQAGLKALVSGLVGGPALVGEWEKQWRIRFGGEEKDEVEGEDEEGDDDESEDEEGDEGDEEGGGGRKRKRTKASTGFNNKKPVEKKEKKSLSAVVAPLSSDTNGIAIPEKRKRGRPRKVLAPPPVTLNSVVPPGQQQQDEVMQPPDSSPSSQWQQQAQQQQPPQFLLAAFALFSFFNSPLTGTTTTSHSPHHHHHTGKVLTPVHPPLVYAPEIVSQFVPLQNPVVETRAWTEYVQFLHLFVSLLVLASFIWNWFGFRFGRTGLGDIVVRRTKRRFGNDNSGTTTKMVGGIDGWIRLGEESILEGGW